MKVHEELLAAPKVRSVKKIPPELRRRKPNYALEPLWYRRLLWRLRDDQQFLRSLVQFSFAALCLWIGVEFSFFMRWGTSAGQQPFFQRPPGVEGFLPISALMSLSYWLQTGIIPGVHPSGLFILVAILGVSLAVKKAFCSWLCPVGTLSESLWMLGQKLFRKNITVPRWVDVPLRSLKYILLFFFAWSIVRMDVPALAAFIESPYNKVADIKMYLFFARISETALWTIGILMAFSIVVKNFWCRYLCPYGALLGLVSLFSPWKVTRTSATCIDCALCTKACPANIAVHKVRRVRSDECTSCLACVDACPVKQTLVVQAPGTRGAVRPWVLALIIAGIFTTVTGVAMLTGHWQNEISRAEYLRRFRPLDSPLYQHFRGQVPAYGPND